MKISGRTYFLFFCIGFCLGVFVVNMGKGILLNDAGLFSEDTLYQMKYMTADGNALFSYVFRRRMLTLLLLVIISTTYLGFIVCRGIVVWYGISAGIFLCTISIRYGVKGILLAIICVFPHYLIYVPAMLLLLKWCEELFRGIYRKQGSFDVHDKRGVLRRATRLFGIFVLFVVGCALEGYVNLALLIKFLQVF